MSLSLETANNAANFVATAAFDIVSKGASLAKEGSTWVGHQVVLLGPVLKEAASTVSAQAAKVAATLSRLFLAFLTASKAALTTLAAMGQKAFEIGAQFAKDHPKDIKIALAAFVIGIVGTVFVQAATAESQSA
jgi:hypothetical protein